MTGGRKAILSRRVLRGAMLLVLCGALLPSAGCAMRLRSNRPLTTALVESLGPHEEGQWWSNGYPVMGLLVPITIFGDAFLVHPSMELDDAGRHTADVAWRTFGNRDRYMSDVTFVLGRVIVTPFVFLINWIYRCVDDVDSYPQLEWMEPDPEPSPDEIRPEDKPPLEL